MATHSSILAWRIPRTEEPGGLQSMGSHRVSTRSHAPSAGLQALPLPPLTENQAALCRSDSSSAAWPGGILHPASCPHAALVKRVGSRAQFWVQIPAQPLTSCVRQGLVSGLRDGSSNSIYPWGLTMLGKSNEGGPGTEQALNSTSDYRCFLIFIPAFL